LDGIRRALGQLLERVDPGGGERRAESDEDRAEVVEEAG
jgi:hypothetical protein